MCDPTQQRTCLWPLGLRNDVKRSGSPGYVGIAAVTIRLVAGSFDRFAIFARRLDRRAFHQGEAADDSESRPFPC